jgi:hypothetical protein
MAPRNVKGLDAPPYRDPLGVIDERIASTIKIVLPLDRRFID